MDLPDSLVSRWNDARNWFIGYDGENMEHRKLATARKPD
jgi:hypothetical protein